MTAHVQGLKDRDASTVPSSDADRVALALDVAGILGSTTTDLRTGLALPDARFAQTFGLDPEACRLGMPAAWMRQIIHPDDLAAFGQARAGALERGGDFAHRLRLRRPAGSFVWVEIRGRVERDADGSPCRVIGVLQDIDDRVAAEEALREAQARAAEAVADLQAILDAAPVAIWIARDVEARLIEGNRTGREVVRVPDPALNLSKSAEEAASAVAHFRVLDPAGREIAPDDLPIQRAARGETLRDFEERVVFDDGEERWLLGHAVPLLDAEGRPRGSVGAFADITARKAAEAGLQRARQAAEVAARHDSLTGLLCRAGFRERLDQELATPGDPRPGRRRALLMLDLDGFKAVNDALGHPAGDRLLREVGLRLRGALREGDLVGRVGGDEFVVLLRHLGGEAEAEAFAQRLLRALGRPYGLDGREIAVSASVGIVFAEEAGESADRLMKRADIALYRAKAAGRLAVRVFEPSMEAEAEARSRLLGELHGAAERGEMRLHYQPILDLGTGRVVGAEALLRWQHPRRGLVGPDAFIPLAEESGEIVPLGAWVLRQACREAAAWPSEVGVSVNLSPRQLRSPDLQATVDDALARAGLAPERLQLEITESMLLEDAEAGVVGLKARGLRVAIDDFGAGYASLGYLRRLAIDTIKVDRGYIAGFLEDARSQAILRAMIGLGQELGLAIVAEGVERPDQAGQLGAMGCTLAQGFMFGRPVPPEAFAELLAHWRP